MVNGNLTYHSKSKDLAWHTRRIAGFMSSHPRYDFDQKHGATIAQLIRRLAWRVSGKQCGRWHAWLRKRKRAVECLRDVAEGTGVKPLYWGKED